MLGYLIFVYYSALIYKFWDVIITLQGTAYDMIQVVVHFILDPLPPEIIGYTLYDTDEIIPDFDQFSNNEEIVSSTKVTTGLSPISQSDQSFVPCLIDSSVPRFVTQGKCKALVCIEFRECNCMSNSCSSKYRRTPVRHSPSEPVLRQLGPLRRESIPQNLLRFQPVNSKSTTCILCDRPSTPSYCHRVKSLLKQAPKSSGSLHVPAITDSFIYEKDADGRKILATSAIKTNLVVDDFLPKSYSWKSGYQQAIPDISEAEAISSLLSDHNSMMTIFSTRDRTLKYIYSIWHYKDTITAVKCVLEKGDLGVLVDILGIILIRPTVWNLDLCVLILPSIYELVQSKYEKYLTVGCNTLKFILINFAQVIKVNIKVPIQTIGVDISREERHKKSIKCYNKIIAIRNILQEKHVPDGKLGSLLRQIQILMQSLN